MATIGKTCRRSLLACRRVTGSCLTLHLSSVLLLEGFQGLGTALMAVPELDSARVEALLQRGLATCAESGQARSEPLVRVLDIRELRTLMCCLREC